MDGAFENGGKTVKCPPKLTFLRVLGDRKTIFLTEFADIFVLNVYFIQIVYFVIFQQKICRLLHGPR